MAHFYATAQGNLGSVSRTGSKTSGSSTTNNSWSIGVTTDLHHHDQDQISISLTKGSNSCRSLTLPHIYLDNQGDFTSSCPKLAHYLKTLQDN